MEEYNYLSSYGDYGSPSELIPKKTVDDITANAPKELDTFKEVADKISEIEGGGGSSSDVEALAQTVEQNKAEADAKFGEIDAALENKVDTSELANLATKEEVTQVVSDVQKLIDGAPEDYDTLKEILDLIETKGDATEILAQLSQKVDSDEFNAHVTENSEAFAAINETMATKLDSNALEGYVQDANYVHTDNNFSTEEKTKLEGLNNYDDTELSGRVEALENANYVQDANYVHTDNNFSTEEKTKLEGLSNYDDTELVERVEAIENANYVEDANYVHTDNNYTTEEKTKLEGLSNYDDTELVGRVETLENANYVEDANYVHTDNNYTTEEKNKLESLNNYDDTELAGRVTALEEANYVEDANYVHTDNNYTTEEKTKLEGLNNYDDSALVGRVESIENANYVEDANYVHTDNNYTTEEKTKLEGLSNYDDTELSDRVETLENAGFLTAATGDARYYDKATTDSIFVAKSQYDDDMELKADKDELGDYATDSELASAVHDLVVRLSKLEAQNAILVEKGTDSADDINGMSTGDALNADIVVATNDAIEALSTPKTFNSISIAGGEVGDNTVINLLAKDSIDVNGLTVSGEKGTGNGKIIFGSNDVAISNVNIEPGCTVYNVFEGKQDKNQENCIDNFQASNITVNDVDLRHNVFNIYQVNSGANIIVKDSVFNLNVAKSNIMRISNITNAENVTITFENVDWNYEDKPYSESDIEWAGLLIYQPYGSDIAYNADYSKTQTWTINVKNCRYNGKHITQNAVGTIEQAVYQYDINGSGACEAPNAFGTVNVE